MIKIENEMNGNILNYVYIMCSIHYNKGHGRLDTFHVPICNILYIPQAKVSRVLRTEKEIQYEILPRHLKRIYVIL